jgi:hypothetical protein
MNSYTITISFRGTDIEAEVDQHIDFYLVQFDDPVIVKPYGPEHMFDANKEPVASGHRNDEGYKELCEAIQSSLPDMF